MYVIRKREHDQTHHIPPPPLHLTVHGDALPNPGQDHGVVPLPELLHLHVDLLWPVNVVHPHLAAGAGLE